MFQKIRLRPVALVVSGILLTFTFLLGTRPYYNWDMFPYMAVIMARADVPFDSTHREVYRAAKDYLPPQDFQAVTVRQPHLAQDPDAFHSILKYFTIKPGYTNLAEFFYRLGIHPVLATCLPSLLSYLAVGLIVFFWSQTLGNPFTAALFTVCVALSSPMRDLARYSSPDMLCAALSVGGFALILTARSLAGLCLLFGATWVRPDALLLLIPIALALAVARSISWGLSASFILTASASAWFILGSLEIVLEYTNPDPSVGRWESFTTGIGMQTLYSLLFLAMGISLLALGRKANLAPLRAYLLWAGLVSLLARYALHPVIEDRFNLPVYFLILMIGWEALQKRQNPETVILR